jgi:hypothetical protein
MVKSPGRLCFIKKNGTTIGGGRTVSMTVNGSPINVEDQGDLGFATYLAGILTGQSIELSIDGYEDGQVLRDIALGPVANRFLDDITFNFPNGDELSGDYVLSAYTETGALEDGQTFSATFSSDGAWTFTGAA